MPSPACSPGAPPRNRVPASQSTAWKPADAVLLLLLTFAAFLLNGYHPFVEDAAFYVPAVEKALQPTLFPHGAEFFESHASLTWFPELIAGSVRLLHLRLETVLLLWHLLCLYLFLFGCWQVICACFDLPEARWGGVGLVSTLLSLPAGATGVLLFDQYLNPRSFSSGAGMLAIALAVRGRYAAAAGLLAATALIHPLMPVYSGIFLLLIWGLRRWDGRAMVALVPFGISLDPPSPAYHQAALLHSWHYIQNWTWYQWLGTFVPLAILVWLGRFARARAQSNLDVLCRSLAILLLCSVAGALVLDLPSRFEALARLQPMRSLHLAYILFFLFLGAMLGQSVLRRRWWRWLMLFGPLCAGALGVQLRSYPSSAHVEWPWETSRNQWVQAFVWIRANTPGDATFALDPAYLDLPGEDGQNFRAIAQRSMLADRLKDSGAVTMFPGLAEDWWQQVEARRDWNSFNPDDFHRMSVRYGVNWVVLQQPGVPSLACPYRNDSVLVCQTH